MDFWKNLSLTESTLRLFVDNQDVLKKTLEDDEKCSTFLNRFPFEQILNISIFEGPKVMLCLELLELFTNYEAFYLYDDRIKYTLDFVLLNLGHVSQDCGEILPLIKLLSKIVSRYVGSLNDSLKNVFDKERILEALVKMSKFKSVQDKNFLYYAPVLIRLLETNFPDSLNNFVSELFETFKEHGAVIEQAITCKFILNSDLKILCECFRNIWEWLLENCPYILLNSSDEDILENVLCCLITIISKSNTFKSHATLNLKNLFVKLREISSDICLHSCNPQLRSSCFLLLSFILLDFLMEEKTFFVTQNQILNQFDNFPEEVEQWPLANQDVFFCICHLCEYYSRMLWKKQDVINAMMRRFDSRRHFIKPHILKSMYYLYPVITDGAQLNFFTRVLSDDLLTHFVKLCKLPQLYSYNTIQLKWMLNEGPEYVKLMAVYRWLKVSEDDEPRKEMLSSTIKQCNSEIVLLQLILTKNVEENIRLRAALLLRKLSNAHISSMISLLLPLVVEKPISFYHLIMAEPGTRLDTTNLVLISSLMGAVIPTLADTDVLRGVCIYSSKLLSKNRNESSAVRGFCRNHINLRYLLNIVSVVDDNTAVEIIRLLKVIIILQQHNKIVFDYCEKENFVDILKGSPEKIEKGLRLLNHSMSYKHSVIMLDDDAILKTYQVVLDCTLYSFCQSVAYECVVSLLKRVPWLNQTISTSVHIEMACFSSKKLNCNDSLLKMLDVWLTAIKKEPYNGFCRIPEIAIKNFIKTIGLTKQQEQQYLKTLDELRNRERCLFRKIDIFSS